MTDSIWKDGDCPGAPDQACDRPLGHPGGHRAYLSGGNDPLTSSALLGLVVRDQRRCGIHGDDTSDGRCGSCDQVAYDQAQDHLEREREQREAAGVDW